MNAQQYSRMAKDRWLAAGVEIPHDTTDVLLAIKREIWTRGLSILEVAQRIGIAVGDNGHAGMLSAVLAGQQRLQPNMLDRIIDAVHITPRVARRLHAMAAIKAGWKISIPED